MKNTITLVIITLIIVAVGVGYGISQVKDNQPIAPAGDSHGINEFEWTKGNPDADVALVEYSDFQCPACASYFPILGQLVDEFSDQIAFTYKHYPLSQIHPQAEFAARVAEAAGIQGQFWQMHDLLFENQAHWSANRGAQDLFFSYGESLGLDMDQFAIDIDSVEVTRRVSNNRSDALRLGLGGTPSFLLNDQLIRSPQTLEEFRTVINQALVDNEES